MKGLVSCGRFGGTSVSAHTDSGQVCLNTSGSSYDAGRGHMGIMLFLEAAHARKLAEFIIAAADACDAATAEKGGAK